jgi:hypothetical protein
MEDMPILTAPVARDWMDQSANRFAYRCLPLAIANQAGWVVPSPVTFSACWNGDLSKEGVTITCASGTSDPRVVSHFGSAVVTITLPYLFRTPPGVNLWVKGPANWIKDGVQALEGVVESDWMPATFTMNWKLTRPHYPVRFEQGEPICMLVPVPRGLAESLQPRLSRLQDNPELAAQYDKWRSQRSAFLGALTQGQPEALARSWQRDYMKGLLPDGGRAPEHQTRLRLKEFTRVASNPTSGPLEQEARDDAPAPLVASY